jgi:hypothetical protein
MATTQAATTHDQHKSPIATQQTPQGQTCGQRQPEQGLESGPPLHRYLGNSYVQSLAITQSASRQESALPPIVREILHSSGQPLDPTTRAFMESRFDADFSQVRVHSDGQAVTSARALQSSAYTVGRDIIFGAGQFAPHTAQGQRLLAHELTHVVQQGQSASSPHRLVNSPADTAEVEADRISTSILTSSRNPIVVKVSAQRTATVQRQVSPEELMFLPRPEFKSANALKEFSPKTPSPTFRFGRYATGGRAEKLVTAETLLKWAFEEAGKGTLFDDLVRQVMSSSYFEGGSPEEKRHWVSVLRDSEPELRATQQQWAKQQRAAWLYAIEEEKRRLVFRGISIFYKATDRLSSNVIVKDKVSDVGEWKIVPYHISREDLKDNKQDLLVYYLAYNKNTKRNEFIIGPDSIDTFVNNVSKYRTMRNSYYWFVRPPERTDDGYPITSGQPSLREIMAVRMGEAFFEGDYDEMGQQWRGMWKDALTDPYWYAEVALNTALASVPVRPATPGPVRTPAPIKPTPPSTPASVRPPRAPVGPASVAKDSPIPRIPRVDVTQRRAFSASPAKPVAPAPAPAQSVTPPVGTPAPVKPTSAAAPVGQPPASLLSRWDRLKMLLRTKYLEAAMRSKLDEVVPTKIAGGSLPGQRPAVTAKAPAPSPAPTPTPLPRTSARPPTVSPAQTSTPLAPSRPTTTGDVVKTPAPATPTSPAATGPTVGTPAPAPKQGGKTSQASPLQISLPRVYTPQAANENAPPEKTSQQQVEQLAATGTDDFVGPIKIIKSGKQKEASRLRIVASGERETPGRGAPVVGSVQPSDAPAPPPPQRPSPTPPPGGNVENEPTEVDQLPPSASQGEQPVSRHVIRRSQLTSHESLNAFLAIVWVRRQEILAEGNAGAVYDLYRYKPDSASRTELSNEQRARFLRSQETLAQEQGFPKLTQNEQGEFAGQPGRREGRLQFSIQQGDPETGFLHFYNRRIELEPNQLDIVERIYLCVKAENALEVMRFVTSELVNDAQITGIGGAKLAGPGEAGRRRDTIVIYSEGVAYTQRAVERLLEYQRTHPNHFEDFPVPMTQPISRGISIGSDPVNSSEEVSFGSVRAEAIYEALREATSREDFFRRVEQNFRIRRIDPAQPRRNLPPPMPPPSRPTQPLRRR